ncbi:restriction endonuclease subunit S [Rhizobium binae]|uniref:restriction endonuclease subunit S n=1 Tax=Rhizobium binae TaxID=1138190 RepID=UPI003DAA2E71
MSVRTALLQDVCEINPRAPKNLNDETPVSFLPMSAVSEDGYVAFEEARTYGEVKKGYTYFERGDVLIAKITPCFENGKAASTATIQNKLGFGSTEFHVLRPSHDLDPKYAFYLLWSDRFRTIGEKGMTGSAGQKRVPADLLRRLEIPLPHLDEQKRIAAILDKADQLRQKRRHAMALLDSLTQSIFLEMFGDLVDKAKQSSSSLTVADVGRVQLGRQRAPKYQTGKFTRPYIRVANVYEDRIDLSDVLSMDFDDRDFRDYKLESGDILLNEGQSTELVGRPAMWRNEIQNCCFQNTLVRFQSDRTALLPEFALSVFLHYFRTGEFAKISSKTSSVAHLGASRFSRMPFPLPSIAEQSRFVERALRAREIKATSARGDADALFASLQHRAFSGQL